MGLPDFLFDSHKRYKADTNRVAAWLAETAQKYGHTLKAQTTTSKPAGSGRLKGKARKEAKKAAVGGALPTTNITTEARCMITTQEFTDMAELITKQNPPVKIPQMIITLLRSAISLRKRCSDWFRSKAGHEAAKNMTHSHFIQVLEKVQLILQRNSSPDAAKNPSTTTTPDSNVVTSAQSPDNESQVDNMTNIFDILNIEENELDETAEASAPPEIPGTSINTTPPRRYEVETDDEEIYFALYCFFDDLDRLRDFILDLWIDYKEGDLDLITASVTTNMAFQLVSRAEQDLIATFPMLKSYEEISGVFYVLMCQMRGQDPSHRRSPDDLVNPAMLDVACWLYMPTASLLESFCDVIKSNTAPILKPGHFGIYDPNVDRSQLSARQQFQEDKIILLEALPEFFIASKLGRNHLPVTDELTSGLLSTFSSKIAPLWVIYACQIFVDINHVLRADVSRGLSELRMTGVRATVSLTLYFESSGPRTFVNWPASNEQAIKGISGFIDLWIKEDAFSLAKSKMLVDHRQLVTPQPFALFRRHPILCGLLQFKTYTLLKEAGITLANAWGSILYVAHLYNACRQGGYLEEEEIWPDMELVMDIHTREAMFSGKLPQTPEEWLKSMALMLGASPQNFARSSRIGNLKMSRKGPKAMTSTSPVSDVFHNEYFATGNATLTLETVQKLLGNWKGPTTTSAVVDNVSNRPQSLLQKQWAKSHKITPLQFLDTLRHAIAVEEPMLRFDYFTFHLRCLGLLRDLRNVLDDKMRQYFGNDYLENDTQLPFIVGYIFQVANGTASIGEMARLRDNLTSLMMTRAATVVKEYIEKEGNAESNKLEKICVNWSRETLLTPEQESLELAQVVRNMVQM